MKKTILGLTLLSASLFANENLGTKTIVGGFITNKPIALCPKMELVSKSERDEVQSALGDNKVVAKIKSRTLSFFMCKYSDGKIKVRYVEKLSNTTDYRLLFK